MMVLQLDLGSTNTGPYSQDGLGPDPDHTLLVNSEGKGLNRTMHLEVITYTREITFPSIYNTDYNYDYMPQH